MRVLIVAFAFSFLFACSGETTDGGISSSSTSSSSSSSNSSSSSASSSSSSTGFVGGDEVSGSQIFSSQKCSLCHADEGQGNDGIFGGIAPIDVNNWLFTQNPDYNGVYAESLTGLRDFIFEQMPLTNPMIECDEQCAADTAAYLWSLRTSTTQPPVDPGPGLSCNSNDSVYYGQRSLKLLTSYEYHNSLQRLFSAPLPHDYSSVAKASADVNIARLPNHKHVKVGNSRLDLYDLNALEIAQWALSNPSAFKFSCSNYSADTCITQFFDKFVRLAYRRPLKNKEQSELSKMIKSGITPEKGMEWAIRTVLGSANFLYRSELGKKVSNVKDKGWNLPPLDAASGDASNGSGVNFAKLNQAEDTAWVLDPYEYASLLSYMYTASSPDQKLLKAADAGDLENPVKVRAQIERLMNSSLGHEQTKRFVAKWLKTDGVKVVTRNRNKFTEAVKDAMAEEVRRFYEHVFYDDSAPFSELYNADYTFLNSTLSDFYGIPSGAADADQYIKVPTIERGGVITSGAFMAFNAHTDETAPIIRSVSVRQNMLCQEVPPPPTLGEPGSDRDENLQQVKDLEEQGILTTTDKYDLLTNVESCASCHLYIINPLFGMDDFNHIGLPRKVINGEVVQKGLGSNGQTGVVIEWVQNGALYGIDDIANATQEALSGGGIHFQGAKDLSKQLANHPATQQCYMQRLFRYGTGFPLNSDSATQADKTFTQQQEQHFDCVTNDVRQVFDQTNQNPFEVYREMGLSDVLRFRK